MKILHAIEVRIETVPAHSWIPAPGDKRVTVQEYVKVIRLNGDLEPLYGVGLDVLDALTDLARALEHKGIEVDIFSFPAGN